MIDIVLKSLTANNRYLRKLDAVGLMPKFIDITEISPSHVIANVYYEDDGRAISQKIATGLASSRGVAIQIALTEWVERHAFIEAAGRNEDFGAITRSDGIAAFPHLFPGLRVYAKSKARINALSEAFERFVWATWWDNEEIGHHITNLPAEWHDHPLIKACHQFIPHSHTKIVSPWVTGESKLNLYILIASLANGGLAVGGAAGPTAHIHPTLERASSELLRHTIAIHKLRTGVPGPGDLYDQRLSFFASPDGQDLVNQRLSQTKGEKITIPPLLTDRELQHKASSFVYVHRCLFKDQPQFLGGKLERFCI